MPRITKTSRLASRRRSPVGGLHAYAARVWHSAVQRVMSITCVGMLLGLMVDVLIAARLGASPTADALVIALSLPLLIDTVMRDGTKFSMVPLFIERRAALREAEYVCFVSGLLNLALVVGAGGVGLIAISAPWIVMGLAPGLSAHGQQLATRLLRLCGCLIPCALGITVFSVFLNSQRHFSLVALRNTITPAIVVMTMALAWQQEQVALWIAAAYVTGFLVFFGVLFVGVRQCGYRHQWSAWVSREDAGRFWYTVALPTLAIGVRQGSRVIERLLASLIAPGGVALYYFAFRIISALQTLIGTSLASTGLPKMARHDLAGNRGQFVTSLRKNLACALLLSGPVMVGIMVLHEEIIRWLYWRGAFGATAVEQTAQILFCFAGGLIFFCLVPILQASLHAQTAYKLVFRNAFSMALVNIALAWGFSQWWGLAGVAMSASISAMLGVGNLLRLLHQTGVPLRQLISGRVHAK